jgi:transposase
VAVLEVCGFNDWLIRMLEDYRCTKVILIQPDDRKKRMTDRRDAAALSEMLWANRDRLVHGKPPSSHHTYPFARLNSTTAGRMRSASTRSSASSSDLSMKRHSQFHSSIAATRNQAKVVWAKR